MWFGLSLQLVVDSQGEIYGCWPTNRPAVTLWSNLPATAQLRSPSYQQRYQQWVTKVSEGVPGTNKGLDVSQGFAQLSFLYKCASLVVHLHVFAVPAVLTIFTLLDRRYCVLLCCAKVLCVVNSG